MSTRDFSWGKGGRCVRLTTYHPCSAETSRKSRVLIYPEPLGPPRPVAGDLYFFFIYRWRSFPLNQVVVSIAGLDASIGDMCNNAERRANKNCEILRHWESSLFFFLQHALHYLNPKWDRAQSIITRDGWRKNRRISNQTSRMRNSVEQGIFWTYVRQCRNVSRPTGPVQYKSNSFKRKIINFRWSLPNRTQRIEREGRGWGEKYYNMWLKHESAIKR